MKEKEAKMRKTWLCLQNSEKNFRGNVLSRKFEKFVLHSRNLSHTGPTLQKVRV